MFAHIVPNFEKGRVLKTGMLENLRDYPRSFLDIQYQHYSEGILAGAEVAVGSDGLTVSRGIVKFSGRMYMLEHDYKLSYEATGRETVLKIRFHPEEREGDYTRSLAEIVLEEDMSSGKDTLELGRFKLKEGARLRSDYQSFADLATEYNTFHVIHVEYAGTGRSTLSPFILRYFARELLGRGTAEPTDIAFAMLCLNQPMVEREVILHYLAGRLGGGYREYDNAQIHKHLVCILSSVSSGGRMKSEFQRGGPQRLIVD